MKNIFLAFLLLAGTAVMAQNGSMKAETSKMEAKESTTALTAQEEIQKSLDITTDQAEKVMAIQKEFCSPDGKNARAAQPSAADHDKAFHAALTEVISAEKADKFMKDCKISCATADAKAQPKGKSCCASKGASANKSCGDKKK